VPSASPSTFQKYRPGVGYAITRANIEWIRGKITEDRARRKDDRPVTPDEIFQSLFCLAPEPRHTERFNRLV
jgi:hypothetical protein